MNPATHATEGSVSAPVLYMALELSNKTWRLAFSDGAKRRQVSVPAADLAKLSQAVAKAKERFGMPAWARVVSCYEAGRDGFWLHRHLLSLGIENEVVDAASIEVSRRLRHVKTDRMDGDRLLAKLIRHHAGERGGWSVVRVPSAAEEDARRLHRELERLKRERLAHRVRIQSLLVTQGLKIRIKRGLGLRLDGLTLWDGRALPQELKAVLACERDLLAARLRAHHFRRLISFIVSISRSRSATIFLSLAFSSSS
jgi:transposase